MTNRRKRRREFTNAKLLIIGVLIFTGCFLLSVAIFTLGAMMTQNPTSLIEPIGLASLILSGGAGAFITAKLKGEGGMLPASLCALFFTLICLIVGLIAHGAELPLRCLVNYLCYMGVALLFAFLGSRERAHHHKRRK